ncbi:hypothetical protein JCM6882_008899 [Rhodosporidiobolus microsporus]
MSSPGSPRPTPSASFRATGTLNLPPSAASRIRKALKGVEGLWDDEEALIQQRSAKRSSKPAAAGKLQPAHCVYPEPRTPGPKKRLSKTHRILRDIKRELEAVLAGGTAPDPLDEDSEEARSPGQAERDPSDETALLHNPLAVLAQQACEAAAVLSPSVPAADEAAHSERYYEGGLYLPRPETELSLDPVESAILNLKDLTRLTKLYFTHLRPFIFLLLPEMHTVDFLRKNSPFLVTAVAYVSSTFDPASAHITQPLAQHARRLSLEILDSGLKSLEIVQAFFILAHWASPENAWQQDRAWQLLGHSWRMATELRIDITLHHLAFSTYGHASEINLDLINRNRQLTWACLFCGELAMSVQTGRVDCLRPPPIPPAANATPSNLPVEYPDYNYTANLQLNCTLVRAIYLSAQLRQEGAREGSRVNFQSSWKAEMEAWRARWPDVNPFIDVHGENHIIILNLMALRLAGGSAQSIFEDVREAAIRTIQKVSSWDDRVTQLPYGSNYVVVHIAYGAVLLLQLSQRFHHGVSVELQDKILRIASILEQVGKNRPNASSIATLHAARLRRLVSSFSPPNASSPATSNHPVPWSGPPMPPVFPLPAPSPQTLASQLPNPPPLSSLPHTTTATAAHSGGPAFAPDWSFAATELLPLDFADFAMPAVGGWWELDELVTGEPGRGGSSGAEGGT